MNTRNIQNIEQFKEYLLNKGSIEMYHGSREGIIGDIKPQNRKRKNGACDFGEGFYMGTNPQQAEGLVANKKNKNPKIYTLELDITNIPKDKILFLDGAEWLYTILSFRSDEELSDFSKTTFAENLRNKVNNYDLVIGYIADDRMQLAMEEFMDNGLTDIGLYSCLNYIDFGFQIAAKTDLVCKENIKILNEYSLFGYARDRALVRSKEQMSKCINVVDKMKIKYRKEGKLYGEIIEDLLKQEVEKGLGENNE